MSNRYRRDFVKVIHVSVLIDATSEQEADALFLADLMARSNNGNPRPLNYCVDISEPKALTGEMEVFRSMASSPEEKERLRALEVDHVNAKVDVQFRKGGIY